MSRLLAFLRRNTLEAAFIALWLGTNAVCLAWMATEDARLASSLGIPWSAYRCYEARDAVLPAPREGDEAIRLNFRLMTPAGATPGKPLPLLLFLHGAGERGYNNLSQLKGLPAQMTGPMWRARFPCFLVAPQCPHDSSWSTWMDDLERLIERLCEEYPIDRRRVYLTGLSMGGFGSWELAARRPDLFAAVVPICGGGNADWGEQLKDLPLWAIHGDADNVVPVEGSRDMIAAVRDAGGQPRYTELPGVRHDSWTETYRDPEGVLRWMFEQTNDRTNPVSSTSDP